MKTIRVTFAIDICVPDKAEIICIKDDDGISEDYIRVTGKLVRPALHWMEYFSKQNPDPQLPIVPGLDGISFAQVDEDFEDKFLTSNNFGEYTLEEQQNG